MDVRTTFRALIPTLCKMYYCVRGYHIQNVSIHTLYIIRRVAYFGFQSVTAQASYTIQLGGQAIFNRVAFYSLKSVFVQALYTMKLSRCRPYSGFQCTCPVHYT